MMNYRFEREISWPAKIQARSKAWWLVSLLVIAGAACTSALAPEQDTLSNARARWNAGSPEAYTYRLQRSCFCGTEFLRPIQIDVIDGVVVAAVYADDGEPILTPLDEVSTIEDLFDEVQDAIDRDAHSIDAEYDASLGYPESVSIDFELQAIDEEMAFFVSDFDVLALPAD